MEDELTFRFAEEADAGIILTFIKAPAEYEKLNDFSATYYRITGSTWKGCPSMQTEGACLHFLGGSDKL